MKLTAFAVGVLGIALFLITKAPMMSDRGTKPEAHCVSHLRQIDAMVQTWVLEHKNGTNLAPTWDHLAEYFSRTPRCPSGGIYTLSPMPQPPVCSVREHSVLFLAAREPWPHAVMTNLQTNAIETQAALQRRF
jgi:hypothetical protein